MFEINLVYSHSVCRQFCREVVQSIDTLIEESPDDDAVMDFTRERIPLSQFQAYLEKCQKRFGDRSLGIAIGSRLKPACYHLLGHLLMSSKTLGEALNSLLRYYRLIINSGEMVVHIEQQQGQILWEPSHESGSSIILEMVFSSIWQFGVWATGRAEPLSSIQFSCKKPGYSQDIEHFFACEVEYDAPLSAIYFPEAWNNLSMLSHNAEVNQLLMDKAQQELIRIHQNKTSLDQLRYFLSVETRIASVTLDMMAEKLNISSRTLQRHLSQENTSLKSELAREKLTRSKAMLSQSNLSICEIALRLGYAEQSSFTHAYKRRYGITPNEARKKFA